ncbi:hypothetical protein [uncultured Clostridium sp.]|jgi:hypothetical protein|uniref:hypothetical protein n=1 Tax=uncultured Clostridium sp. TaxID=59620 RepID=UPI0026093E06|nr:hypothetical protein [uncultured Clostridium sp.]
MHEKFSEKFFAKKKIEYYTESYYKPEGWNEALRLLKSLGFSVTGDNSVEKLLRMNNRIRRRHSCYDDSKMAKIYLYAIKIIELELRRLSNNKFILDEPK